LLKVAINVNCKWQLQTQTAAVGSLRLSSGQRRAGQQSQLLAFSQPGSSQQTNQPTNQPTNLLNFLSIAFNSF